MNKVRYPITLVKNVNILYARVHNWLIIKSSVYSGDTRPEVELRPPDPGLAPYTGSQPYIYSPVPDPYTGSHNSVLHLKGSKHDNQTGCRIATPYTGSLHRLPVLHIAIRWLHTQTPYIRFYLKGSHKDIFKNETPIRIPNCICFQENIST